MAASDSRRGARGDEAELFRAFNDELMRRVASAVRHVSRQTIEDACAFAWAQFMDRQPDRDGEWRGWLFRTAQREAWGAQSSGEAGARVQGVRRRNRRRAIAPRRA